MLGKLIKHEFISDSRLMVPSYAVVLVIALLGRLFTWLSTRQSIIDSMAPAFVSVIRGISNFLSIIYVLAFIALIIMTLFFMIYRFYKNYFTDEGYLMLTLPTTPSHLIFSKLLNAIIWSLFSAIIAIGSFYLALGSAELMDTLKQIWDTVSSMMSQNSSLIEDRLGVPIWVFIVETVLFAIAYAARFIISWYFAIAFGQLLSKKHKIAGAILAYLLLEIASQILSTLFMAFDTQVLPKWIDSLTTSSAHAMQSALIGNGIVMILVAALLYFFTARIMNRKLNLD